MIMHRCTPLDVKVLQQVAIQSFSETYSHANTPENMQRHLDKSFSTELLAQELENPLSHYFLLWDGDEPAGYLKLNEGAAQTDLQDRKSVEIERIYVLRSFQGRGYGRLLLDHSIAFAKKRSKSYVWLGVWEENTNAIAFYEHCGFVKAGTHSFLLGDEKQTDFIMRRQLTE